MRRFFSDAIAVGALPLEKEQARHAKKSLRLEPGDPIELFDGAGTVGRGRVIEARRDVVFEIDEIAQHPRPTPHLTIAAAVPKGDRAATLVEKLSELGVDRFVPLRTQYSVVDPRPGKVDRFRRIAVESAKQCGRAWLLEIAEPIDLERVFATFSDPQTPALRLIADVPGSDAGKGYTPIENFLHTAPESHDDAQDRPTPADRAIVLIGPEGGWTDAERAAAREADYHPWQFAEHTLRVETAAVAAAAILRCGWM